MKLLSYILSVLFITLISVCASGQISEPEFKVIAFYTGKNDAAHVSFVHEANRWFALMAGKYDFLYDSTNNWDNMNEDFLSRYQVVIFLDTRPDSLYQREAFRKFMEKGGAWMGFHFCAFALTPSAFPQDWDWYHRQFLGAGNMLAIPGDLQQPFFAPRIGIIL